MHQVLLLRLTWGTPLRLKFAVFTFLSVGADIPL